MLRLVHAVLSAAVLVLLAPPVRPKQGPGKPQPIQNNCSQSQLNSDIGRQCIAQGPERHRGQPKVLYVYRSSSGAVLSAA